MCNVFAGVSSDVLDAAIKQVKEQARATSSSGGCRDLASVIDAAARSDDRADIANPDFSVKAQRTFPRIRPGDSASILRVHGGKLMCETMSYGYKASWNPKKLIYNARIESALGQSAGMWSESLVQRRCLVPAIAFYEPDRTRTTTSAHTGKTIRQQVRFTLHERPSQIKTTGQDADSQTPSPLFFLAGIYENSRFAIMTCAPNNSVAPVHNRMPIVLRPDEASTWLGRSFASLTNRDGITLEARDE